MKRNFILLLVLATLVLAACAPTAQLATEQPTAQPLNVTVSIVPQKYFVERIGGKYVNVSVMVQPRCQPGDLRTKA